MDKKISKVIIEVLMWIIIGVMIITPDPVPFADEAIAIVAAIIGHKKLAIE